MNRLSRRVLSRSVAAVILLCAAQAAVGNESWDESRRNGTIARHQSRYGDAKRYLEAALAQVPFNPEDVRRADLDDELASVYESTGESAAAERAYQEAVSIVVRHPEYDPEIRSTILGDFGSFRAYQGRLKDAGELLQAALAISRQAFGERGIRTATLKSSLGQLYLLEGRLTESESLLLEATEIHRATLPSRSLTRIVSESSLGYLYMNQGRIGEAEQILRKVSEDARQLGEWHPTLAFTLGNLADIYRAEGRSARSEPLFKKALAIYERSLGPESLRVGETLLDMSVDSIASRKYAIAEEELNRALNILQKVNGLDHPTVALAEYRLAQAYMGHSGYEEAGPLLRHALRIDEQTWPDGHPVVADCLFELAELERLERHYAEAELLYQRAIPIYQKSGPSSAPRLAAALHQYARLLRTTRTEEAKALEKRAQDLQRNVQAFQ